jgi:hypothetical protein
MPLVSPDEHWLALYGRLEGSTKTGLMVLPMQGGGLRALNISDGQAGGYSFSPDSKHLLVSQRLKRVNGHGPDSELYSVSVEGGAPQSMRIRMNGHSSLFSYGRVMP